MEITLGHTYRWHAIIDIPNKVLMLYIVLLISQRKGIEE